MEQYIVSARKYRPTTFDSVVGQQALTTTLKNAIATGKLAHAYLFCGPRGVGKTTCARIFAKTINCLNPGPDGEACNACESCAAFNEQRSYNIHELDAASNNSVDDIRQLVEQVRIPPQIGKYKVYIIDEVHMLSTSAFNAFLKTLEEPPRHAIFILATTEKHKILPTILSRCQIYDFNRISIEDTVAHLANVAAKEGIQAEPEALHVIAQKADGGMRDALSIFDQVVSFCGGQVTYQGVIANLNVLDYEYYFRLTDQLLNQQITDALLLLNEVINKGFDAGHFINGMASHLRNLLVSRDAATLPLLEVGASIRERYQKQAAACPLPFLYRAMKLCNTCDLNYRASKNKRLLVELTLIEVAQSIGEGDDVSGGRSPKQLKPFLKAAQQESSSLQGQPMPQQGNIHIQQPGNTQMQQQGNTQMQQAVNQAQPGSQQQGSQQQPLGMSELLRQKSAEGKRITMAGGRRISISIRQSAEAQQAASQTAAATGRTIPLQSAGNATPEAAADQPISESELNYYWHEYIGQMPKEQIAFAKRMQNIHLSLNDDHVTSQITFDNELAAKEFQSILPSVQGYLRSRLRNSQLTFLTHVAEAEEQTRAVSRNEKLQLMSEKNEAIQLLISTFKLEFN
ncbi:MAG: DNA polymerase III subunit gamma/tau [Bacteroides sp.]